MSDAQHKFQMLLRELFQFDVADVFVNRKQTHLIIENVPTWVGTPEL